MTFFIRQELKEQIEQLAREGYPYEICGFLGGTVSGQATVLQQARNIAAHPRVRYDIAPEETLENLLDFEARGFKLTGVYHSHPDYKAILSDTDIELAELPGVTYLVTAVNEVPVKGQVCETRAFRVEQNMAHEVELVEFQV